MKTETNILTFDENQIKIKDEETRLLALKLLMNKPEIRKNLFDMERHVEHSILNSKRFKNLKCGINLINFFNEMAVGAILLEKFPNLLFEQNILSKTPDFSCVNHGQNLIFEVIKLNLNDQSMKNRIESYMSGIEIKVPTTHRISESDTIPLIYKIARKEEAYRKLVEEYNYKLIICADFRSFYNQFFTNLDMNFFFSFEDCISMLPFTEKLVENCVGIIGVPIFGNPTFISNFMVNKTLNVHNLDILNSYH